MNEGNVEKMKAEESIMWWKKRITSCFVNRNCQSRLGCGRSKASYSHPPMTRRRIRFG